MAILVECIEYAYTEAFEEVPETLCFLRDKTYPVHDMEEEGYVLENEQGEGHVVGRTGDPWFDEHFRVIG